VTELWSLRGLPLQAFAGPRPLPRTGLSTQPGQAAASPAPSTLVASEKQRNGGRHPPTPA